MEKELIINGIKYIREEGIETKEQNEEIVEGYKLIKFCGFDWYVIKEDEESQTLFMKDKLSPEDMEKYFDKSLLDDDKDVKFSYIDSKWRDSLIRFGLNSKFINDLDEDELIKMEVTQKINDKEYETEDYVRLLTIEEARELPIEILESDYEYGYWLGSAYSTPSVWYVSSYGCFYYGSFSYGNNSGVRPVIKICKSDI